MLTQPQFARLYRASAWYDLIVTWPFALAPTLLAVMMLAGLANDSLGFAPIPDLTSAGIMFGNFFGTVVLVWSVVRLQWNDPVLARYDAFARWMFSLAMIIALTNGASPILLGVLIPELTFAVLQSLPVRGG